MKRFILLLCLLLLPQAALAGFDPAPLEEVSRAYAAAQPGLESYRVDIETSKLPEMLDRMTAGMPPGTPRPASPLLRKYWSRADNTSVIRAEGPNVFPYMQEMVDRFSAEFAIDLRALLLPAAGAGQRRDLLSRAEVRSYETVLGEDRTRSIEIAFAEPLDVGNAFFGPGLELPRRKVEALTLELDPDRRILKRLEVTAAGERLVLEVRHREVAGSALPAELRITAPDGSVDDSFVTTFTEVEGYLLPAEQVRTVRRPERSESVTVRFNGYRINLPPVSP